jgi:hypothetical protein
MPKFSGPYSASLRLIRSAAWHQEPFLDAMASGSGGELRVWAKARPITVSAHWNR